MIWIVVRIAGDVGGECDGNNRCDVYVLGECDVDTWMITASTSDGYDMGVIWMELGNDNVVMVWDNVDDGSGVVEVFVNVVRLVVYGMEWYGSMVFCNVVRRSESYTSVENV